MTSGVGSGNEMFIGRLYSFQIYDFLSRTFTSNSMDILIPNNQIYNNFIKFLPNNNLEIDLQFLIKIPYKNKKISALIIIENNYNFNSKCYI